MDQNKKYEKQAEMLNQEYLGIKNFNKGTNVFIGGNALIYEHLERIEGLKTSHYEKGFKFYKGDLGAGNKPIIIETNNKLEIGDNNIYLEHISEDKISEILNKVTYQCLENIAKILRVARTKGKGQDQEKRDRLELIQDLSEIEFSFFKPSLPIDLEEIKKIKNPYETIKKILINNW